MHFVNEAPSDLIELMLHFKLGEKILQVLVGARLVYEALIMLSELLEVTYIGCLMYPFCSALL